MTKVAVVKLSAGTHELRVQVKANSAQRSLRGALGRRLWRGIRSN